MLLFNNISVSFTSVDIDNMSIESEEKQMSVIKSHDVTLYSGNNKNIVLRPLCDEHLPLLYKWCSDPEVLYWTEGGTEDMNLSYSPQIVNKIYGGVSQNAFCEERVDVLHCFCEDYNIRSRRLWEKHGFTRILEEPLAQPQKGRWQYHYRLTCEKFVNKKK